VGKASEAYEAARAFGTFQYLVSDLEGGPLRETLPGFHDTPRRLAALEAAAKADRAGRAAEAAAELSQARSQAACAGLLVSAGLPVRVTHNDTKINNVLFDAESGRGLCVIDLDTVMPGLMPFDFGDLVRTAVSPAAEDEPDLARVGVRLDVFEAIAQGWREGAGDALTDAEKALLPASGRVIAYELGLRFLTDYLDGDRYFKTRRPAHNLHRARVQLRLAAELAAREADLAYFF
jgi:Ser/Thr protein kinase RdoA (MazF antagonist)